METKKRQYEAEATQLQLVCRKYGSDLRYIRGLAAQAKTLSNLGLISFNQGEVIKTFCDVAEVEAKRKYDEERIKAGPAKTRDRASSESR